ncbi:MAG TPA: replicative DNA helicase [Pseudorhodoferax sp.]|nr:replicative DNA helicase [Pseudorhodoferax sp.]
MNAHDDFNLPPDDPALSMLRVPPHSIEAEASVLGGLLLDNDAWDRVGDLLREGDFYRYEHRLVFGVIRDLCNANRPADVLTVLERLQTAGKAEDVGGIAYLGRLANEVPNASNIRRYAEIVRERAVLRGLVAASDEIASLAFNPDGKTVADVLDAAQAKVFALSEGHSVTRDEWRSIYESMAGHTQVIEERAAGMTRAISTGLTDLDEYLEGGLRPGELVIVGARPSMGKTALGLTIGVHVAEQRAVGLLSMEMSHSEVNDRLIAMLGCVSLSAVKRPARGEGLAWDRVVEGVDHSKALNFHASDQGGLNINQVRTKARALKRAGGLDVLVVDYIGLMAGLDAKANRNTQLEEISRGLKNLAKELDICVVCLAQLNRKAEERPDQMPMMSDLRDSGAIEQDADVILFIKRPIMANPELGDDWKHYAKLSVAKNRQGRCGYINLSYIGEQTRFSGWHGEAPRKTVVGRSRGSDM